MLRWNLLLMILAVACGLCCGDRAVAAEEAVLPEIPAMSADAFFALPVEEQRAVLVEALEQRLRLFENISYEARSRRYKVHADLVAFPYQGSIPDPADEIILRAEGRTRCLGESFRDDFTFTVPKTPEHEEIRDVKMIKVCDVQQGEVRSATLVNGKEESQSRGQISHLKEGQNPAGMLTRWGRGTSGRHQIFFIQDAVLALETAEVDLDASPSIKSGQIGDRKTISISYPIKVERRQSWTGIMCVNFDPARQFLPLAYRLERFDQRVEGRKLRWFEAMRVEQAEQQQGIWFPARLYLLQGTELPTTKAGGSALEIQVEAVSFGTVTDQYLAFTFPAGVEVRNYTNGVRFISDGKGGVQGEVDGIPYLNGYYLGSLFGPGLLKYLFPGVGISTFLLGWYLVRRQERIERQQSVSAGV